MSLDKLKDYGLKFCKLKRKEKIPFENGWQKNGYSYEQIKDWVKQGNNYGVLCGEAGLIVIDADHPQLMEFMETTGLPETFQVKTGKGMHYYYFCPEMGKKIVLTNQERFGEIQCWGTQVVGPGSLHPSGVFYTIIKDLPIAKISFEELKCELRDYIPKQEEHWTKIETNREAIEAKYDINAIPIEKIVNLGKFRRLVNGEIIGENPWHGCTGKGNFSINTTKNLAYCFRCDKGMNAAQVIAMEEGLINNCGDPIDKERFLKVLEIAQTKHGLPRPAPKEKTIEHNPSSPRNGKKNQDLKEEECEYVSALETEEFIAEEVVIDHVPKFMVCYLKEGGIQIEDQINFNGLKYRPISGEEIIKEVIGLPSGIEEYGTTMELMQELRMFIRKWLDVDEDHLKFAIYNILRSWVYQRFYTLNYMRALGDHGSGKSRYLDVIGLLHYKPIATSGAITAAVMYRLMEKWHGTLIIDEADRKQSDESDEVIKIINQGYEKNRNVIRCDKERNYELKFFDTYGPKVLATRREFEDKATESRCLTHIMKPTMRTDIPPNLTDSFFKQVGGLRNKMLLWRFRNYHRINPDFGANIDLNFLEPRLKQVSVGFFSMFENDENEISEFKKFLVGMQKDIISTRSDTPEGKIVNAIATRIIQSLDGQSINDCTDFDWDSNMNITAKMIIETAELTDFYGKPWSGQKLGSYMKSLGFSKTIVKRWNEVTIKVYPIIPSKIQNLFKKYISDGDILEQLSARKVI